MWQPPFFLFRFELEGLFILKRASSQIDFSLPVINVVTEKNFAHTKEKRWIKS